MCTPSYNVPVLVALVWQEMTVGGWFTALPTRFTTRHPITESMSGSEQRSSPPAAASSQSFHKFDDSAADSVPGQVAVPVAAPAVPEPHFYDRDVVENPYFRTGKRQLSFLGLKIWLLLTEPRSSLLVRGKSMPVSVCLRGVLIGHPVHVHCALCRPGTSPFS